jgi:DNA gyrase subunit A
MATNIPPHNLKEVVDGCIAVMRNPDITLPELMAMIPGPDFPTGGTIHGASGIREAYETGRGIIHIRAVCEFESMGNDRERIVVHELPYQVNKARLIWRRSPSSSATRRSKASAICATRATATACAW